MIARTFLAVLILFTALAPSFAEPVSKETRDTVFRKLTATTWTSGFVMHVRGAGNTPHIIWTLKQDGTYTYFQDESCTQETSAGRWSIECLTETTGRLRLDSSVMQFELKADGSLLMAGQPYAPGAEVEGDPKASAPEKGGLEPSELEKKLVANMWVRPNDFNLDWTAEGALLSPDGSCTVAVTGEKDALKGTWSLYFDGVSRRTALSVNVPSRPEQRNFGGEVSFIDDLLIVGYGTYVAAGTYEKRGVIWSSLKYEDNVSVRIDFDRPLVRGTDVKLKLTFLNSGQYKATLDSAKVFVGRPNVWPGELAGTEDVSAIVLNTGESKTSTIKVSIPQEAKQTWSFQLKYHTAAQPFNGEVSLILR